MSGRLGLLLADQLPDRGVAAAATSSGPARLGDGLSGVRTRRDGRTDPLLGDALAEADDHVFLVQKLKVIFKSEFAGSTGSGKPPKSLGFSEGAPRSNR